MLTITEADLALAASLGLSLVRKTTTAREAADALDPRATRMPESWLVMDARKRQVGSIHFTPIDTLRASKLATGVTGPEETVAAALLLIAPVIRHVRTGRVRRHGDRRHQRKDPRSPPRDHRMWCGSDRCRLQLDRGARQTARRPGTRDVPCMPRQARRQRRERPLAPARGAAAALLRKQRDFLRRLLDEGARSGRPYLIEARAIDQMSSREASAKIDDLIALKARRWKGSPLVMVTAETITDDQILQVRTSLPHSHWCMQYTIDALVPSASHPNRQRNARNECAWMFNRMAEGDPSWRTK